MQRTDQLRDDLQRLQKNRSNIRNICILAHVDHGKTTLADSLVASNGIISQRQAGKLRYLDSREDEQLRGITMKSSAIALKFIHNEQPYLINLIDSPGHVDFSSEVSMAVRLCDGALVVVDAVEGVCPQTQAVLQQAWVEGIKPCLVLNKIDRLITELKYSPTEAYYHLQQILEQVNAVTGSLFTSEVLQSAAQEVTPEVGQKVTKSNVPAGDHDSHDEFVYDWSSGLEDKDDSMLYFSPEHGNVIFTSALDGWGFGVGHFADMYAKKLGIKAAVLNKTLWGDFYLNTKTKRIFKGAQAKGKKPLFVQFVLDNIWAVYEAVLINKDKARIEKIVNSMNLKISARDSRHTDARVHLFAICSQWVPLASAVLTMVVLHMPSPLQLSRERVEKLMCSSAKTFESFPPQTQLLCEDFLACSPDDSAPVILFISKLFAMEKSDLPQHQTRPLTEQELLERRELARLRHMARETTAATPTQPVDKNADEAKEEAPPTDLDEGGVVFLAFARVYSGTVRKGAELFVLQPRYDPREANLDQAMTTTDGSSSPPPLPSHVSRRTVDELYILMGRGVVSVDEVPAGSVLGIAGLEHTILKSATVSNTLACPAFRPMSFVAAPIVRVAVEPMHVMDMPALVSGMKLLNQADPSVEIYVQESGEHILSTAGEVHLQKCLTDLKNQFAKVKLNVSAPIIPFRETVIVPPKIDMVNEAISAENESVVAKETNHVITMTTANKGCILELEAFPLPSQVTALLENSTTILKSLSLLNSGAAKEEIKLNQKTLEALRSLKENLQSAFSADPPSTTFPWEQVVNLIWSFGPRNSGPNILLNGTDGYKRVSVWNAALEQAAQSRPVLREYDNSIVSGFQLASLSGPLCEEPMMGVGFILRQWNYTAATGAAATAAMSQERQTTPDLSSSTTDSRIASAEESTPTNGPPESSTTLTSTDTYGPFSGQLMSAMKEGCRRAFLAQPVRLMAAMYSCNILATAEVLGRLYGVLGRRNGRVLSDEMKEGSAMFNISAVLPVAESFGFAEEVRKKTSGLASPQLIFSHWEVIMNDPFWVPSTEEELLHFGEKADSENMARRYMNTVRKRKGLRVDEKIVQHAEKQRTLKKNK